MPILTIGIPLVSTKYNCAPEDNGIFWIGKAADANCTKNKPKSTHTNLMWTKFLGARFFEFIFLISD
jgi:hypothetical protein